MPSRSKRKGQILLPGVNRCGSVIFLQWFYSSRGCPPQRLRWTSPRKASAVGGMCSGPLRFVLRLLQTGMSSPGVPPLFFSSSPGTVPVGFRWHCVAFLTLQHWLCRLLLSLSFCFADLSNSLCISSMYLNELHSDPHLSPFQGPIRSFRLHFVVDLPGTDLLGSSVLTRANGIFLRCSNQTQASCPFCFTSLPVSLCFLCKWV